jgi:Flp pilus assembly protein TadB
MAGVVAIVIALLLIPVLVIMAGAVASAIIGETYYRTTRSKFATSELRDLPD